MSSRIAFPFLTLSDTAVSADPWMVELNAGERTDAGDFLPDWDGASMVRLTRRVSFDREVASMDLGIDLSELRLGVALRIGTGSGRLPRLIVHRESRSIAPGEDEIEFDITLPGNRLSSVIDISLDIMLGAVPLSKTELSPGRIGDRLWRDSQRIRIEGEEPRFPIEISDFSGLLGDTVASSSPWYLHWTPRDWTRDFHGSMRLYLNPRFADVIARVEGEDPETLRALMADVMGQICESLVREEDAETTLSQCDPGSLGVQARQWLKVAWPGRDLSFVRSVLENRPGSFRAAFLGLAEPGGAGE